MKRDKACIDDNFKPRYLALHESGELKRRGKALWDMMKACRLCPRECGVDRLAGEIGVCEATSELTIASYQPHHGEEPQLVGKNGSGTIFFSHCGLRCVFCINWDISQGGAGTKISINRLAEIMLEIQDWGCHNINVVTPTHYAPHILLALDIAAANGLRLPLVYNTSGWERMEILEYLDGVVDIYLTDFKYTNPLYASKYSHGAVSYPEVTQRALVEMNRQVGVAKPAPDGLMYSGLMIRHLVMPNNVSGSRYAMVWIASSLPKDTYVNIMSQYSPVYRAREFDEIARKITPEEYMAVVQWAIDAGLTNLEVQGLPY